jgi:hypothetical protein
MLTAETVAAIADEVGRRGLSEETVAALRLEYGGVHFTHCSDDDVGAREPYASYPNFNVYLVDGRDHCLCFTSRLDHATGLVLAEVIDDD